MPPTILDLPIEVIDIITAHLTASPLPHHLLPRNRPPCACGPAHPTVYDEDDDEFPDSREYRDPSLDLSMVCRELRGVVFEKMGRAVNAGLCAPALERHAGMPNRVRDTVRQVMTTSNRRNAQISTNTYAFTHPSTNSKSTGNLQLAKTDLSLAPHLSPGPGSPTHPLKSLRLFMGTGGSDRTAILGACPVAVEMGDVIAHLSLPELETLVLDINLTFGSSDTKDSWEALVVYLGLVKRYEALRDLTIKVTLSPMELEPFETAYWRQILLIALLVLTSGTIKSLHIIINYDFHLFEDNFVESPNGKHDLPEEFVPGEEKILTILGVLLTSHPGLECFGLTIEGSTHSRTWELTGTLLALEFTNRPTTDATAVRVPGLGVTSCKFQKYPNIIDRLYYSIVEAGDENNEYHRTLEAEWEEEARQQEREEEARRQDEERDEGSDV